MSKLELPINYDKSSWQKRKQARLQYIDEQDGLCAYCGTSLNGEPDDLIMQIKINMKLFPKGMFNNPIHLHHDHNTGMTIGAIHAKCNAVLWQYFGQ